MLRFTHRVNGTEVPIYYPETADDIARFIAWLDRQTRRGPGH